MIADSRALKVGQLVFAVGHPWGQPGVVTLGIVSALYNATTQKGTQVPIIRSDSLLAPGNSGGPLVNAVGGVVGINTMIVGGDQGVSLPSHLAQIFVEEAC
jgi:serine protease Do